MNATELIVDSFAGGGGASLGISLALGRGPDIAINHDVEAIAMHAANHPETVHYAENVWAIDPKKAVGGRSVGLMWLSPDCKHFSKAKGGKPVDKRIRGLAWVAVRWAKSVRPRVIILENVEEFVGWGPLLDDGKACPLRKGLTFRRFVRQLQNCGYTVDWQELRACDYGAPTIRKRLFLIARCDGQHIVWPEPTHGRGLIPYRTAAECIDWSIACPSIFERKKPLADATLRRIARGVMKYVVNAAEPFIVPITHTGDDRVHSISEPLRTVTGAHRGEHALISPTLIQTSWGEREGQAPRVPGLHKPLGTIMSGGGKHALVAAFLAQHNGGMVGHSVTEPVSTITEKGSHQQLVSAFIKRDFGTSTGASVDTPLPTITTDGGGHASLVRAFLIKYYGTNRSDPGLRKPLHTVTGKDRFGLVTVHGETYQIDDIGMRMLIARELFRAQGFPDSYIIDPMVNGKPMTKTAQVRMCGNSVCPPVAAALVRANLNAVTIEERAA